MKMLVSLKCILYTKVEVMFNELKTKINFNNINMYICVSSKSAGG